MSTPAVPTPPRKINRINLEPANYRGAKTTLCAGCGHNAISERIIDAFYEMGVDPTRVLKLSGIGCSSKSPAYFLGTAHGFNSVHGRMPSVLTGANLANRELLYLGVSGDGDSASIGLGQFAHAIRRAVDMTYIVENNGVYGLTKGQFSATADRGSKSKRGVANEDSAIDLVALALQLGATYVARGFSGDKAQLVPLIKGAILHRGAAFVDVISPCVAFNNHAGSTRSYDYVRAHNEAVNRIDFIARRDELTADYPAGTVTEIEQHDGTVLRLRKIAEGYDVADRITAMNEVMSSQSRGEILTGLLYVDGDAGDLHERLATPATPLNRLDESTLCPGGAMLERINASLR